MIHICSVCGSDGNWSSSWTWFGSWVDAENGKPVLKFCSDACRRKRDLDAPAIVFDRVGELRRVVTHAAECGGCGAVEPVEAATAGAAKRAAEELGWARHPVGGWLCPTCSAVEELRASVDAALVAGYACLDECTTLSPCPTCDGWTPARGDPCQGCCRLELVKRHGKSAAAAMVGED